MSFVKLQAAIIQNTNKPTEWADTLNSVEAIAGPVTCVIIALPSRHLHRLVSSVWLDLVSFRIVMCKVQMRDIDSFRISFVAQTISVARSLPRCRTDHVLYTMYITIYTCSRLFIHSYRSRPHRPPS